MPTRKFLGIVYEAKLRELSDDLYAWEKLESDIRSYQEKLPLIQKLIRILERSL